MGKGRGGAMEHSASPARVLHVGELVELDVVEFSISRFYAPDVHRLYRFAGLRVDHERTPRAVEFQALQDLQGLVTVDFAIELCCDFEDGRHSIVSAYRHEVGPYRLALH